MIWQPASLWLLPSLCRALALMVRLLLPYVAKGYVAIRADLRIVAKEG